ncbi:hypothetical protein SCUP515_02234 [Seiridium cupressi]
MKLLDDIIYYTCCLVVVLHTFCALLVITHGRCSVYAAAFLIACLMWIDVSILNLWFFVPTIIEESSNINLHFTHGILDNAITIVREVFLSTSASYVYMMFFGWFVGSMSLSNALAMWQKEGCDAMDAHHHSGLSAAVIRLARQAGDCVGIWDAGYLPFLEEGGERQKRWSSCLFAGPRWLHRSYVFVLSPPIKLLGAQKTRYHSVEKV